MMDENGIAYWQRVKQLAELCRQLRLHITWLWPAEVLRMGEQEGWQIVDVHPPGERRVSGIPPSTLSQDAFEAWTEANEPKRVLVYCVIGCHSGVYVPKLHKRGIRAADLWGGLLVWVQEGGTLVNPGGKETRRVHVHGIPWDVLPPGYETVG